MEKIHFHKFVSKSFTRISRVEVQSELSWVKDYGPNAPGKISYWSKGLQKWTVCKVDGPKLQINGP